MSAPTPKPPSLSEWGDRLSVRLRAREEEYLRFKTAERAIEADPETCRALATKTAAFSFLEILSALRELPAFHDNAGMAPLHDLAGALDQLVQGGQPAMLDRWAGKGDGRDPLGRRYVKEHAALCVELLKSVGQIDAHARRAVAKAFTAAGFRGRKGGALSPATLVDWCLDVAQDPDQAVRLRRNIQSVRDGLSGVPTAASIMEWMTWMLEQPLMRSKI